MSALGQVHYLTVPMAKDFARLYIAFLKSIHPGTLTEWKQPKHPSNWVANLPVPEVVKDAKVTLGIDLTRMPFQAPGD